MDPIKSSMLHINLVGPN